MPRRGYIPKREILPDPVYHSPLVTKFINCMMLEGKKSVAEQTFYGAMETIRERTNEESLKIFRKAVDNVKPAVEVKSRRVGGSTYQVPLEVSSDRQQSLAIRWLISYAKVRHEKTMTLRMAAEFLDAANNRGGAIKKRDDTHRMAEANKAFAHYRW